MNNIAWVLAMQRRGLDEALQHAEKALALLDRSPETMRKALRAPLLDTLGFVRYQRGEYEQAARILQEAVELGGDNALFHYHVGMAYYRLGRNGEAASSLRRALVRPDALDDDLTRQARRVVRDLGG